MIADWFASPEPGNPMWAPVIDVIARVTILYFLACAFHCILGRRRALVRSALWNAVLLAAILQSAAALGLPRLRIACLSAIARPVTLVRSGRVRVPMLLGFLRPVIVLPDTAEASAPTPGFQIDAILLRELAHLRRGDDLWNLLQQVVQILYWPHPLVWLGARLIAGVREQACDDLCVRWVGGAGEYRCALVAVASGLVRGPIPSIPTSLGLAMARARSSALLRRLRWIDRSRGASACLLGWPGRLAIGVVVLNLGLVLCSIELL
jgi:hypothetical protein